MLFRSFDTTSPSKDTTSPTVEVVRTGTGTITGPETIYFNFSEATTDFALADISVSGGTMSNLVAVAGSGNKQYIATFTPTASTTGTATIGVKAATFSDAAGNKNKDTFDANDSATGAVQEANNQVSASFDTVPPNPIDQTPPTVAISRDGSGAVDPRPVAPRCGAQEVEHRSRVQREAGADGRAQQAAQRGGVPAQAVAQGRCCGSSLRLMRRRGSCR